MMRKYSPELQRATLEVVENQIRENDPPETRQTLDRLLADGYTKSEAEELIGSVLTREISGMLDRGEEFDRDRYVVALGRLPELPFEEDG